MNALLERFNLVYNAIYDREDTPNAVNYEKAVEYFDNVILKRKIARPVLDAFSVARQDVISSDREAATFVYALGLLPLPECLANV